MKKISLLLVALAAILTFSACRESKDDHPVLYPVTGSPTVNFLNEPEGKNLAILLTQDNKDGYVHMTCSQPQEYGMATSVKYEVEVALKEDFTAVADTVPASILLPTAFYDCAEINPVNDEIASAMEEMMGIAVDDASYWPTKPCPVYMRLSAHVQSAMGDTVPNTHIVSNIVKLESVSVNYFARIIPGMPTGIFIRGEMNGWGSPADWEFLTTDKANVYILEGVSIDAGQKFKVGDSLWKNIDCGANGNLEFNTKYSLTNKGSDITMPANFNGNITLYQNGDNFSIMFEPAKE